MLSPLSNGISRTGTVTTTLSLLLLSLPPSRSAPRGSSSCLLSNVQPRALMSTVSTSPKVKAKGASFALYLLLFCAL